jgi:hypothetical protein
MSIEGFFVLNIDLVLSLGHLEKRRLGDVEVAPFDHLWHMAIEKGEE